MSHELILEEYLERGGGPVLGRLEGGDYLIGREPDYGIAVDRTSISRNHGKFLRVKNHWLYQDLGSTNGSWLNGNPLRKGSWSIVRPGDYLQLADVAIFIRGDLNGSADFNLSFGRSLLVFQGNDQFIDELPVPEYGKALVIGGSQADFEIPGDVADSPSMVIERRGDEIVLYSVAKAIPLICGGVPVDDTRALSDGDYITVANFTVLFNDPADRSAGAVSVQQTESGEVKVAGISEWGEGAGPDLMPQGGEPMSDDRTTSGAMLGGFGRAVDEDESPYGTMAIDTDNLDDTTLIRDRHPSTRHMFEEDSYPVTTTEDKIILILGIFLIMLLFGAGIWWFL